MVCMIPCRVHSTITRQHTLSVGTLRGSTYRVYPTAQPTQQLRVQGEHMLLRAQQGRLEVPFEVPQSAVVQSLAYLELRVARDLS